MEIMSYRDVTLACATRAASKLEDKYVSVHLPAGTSVQCEGCAAGLIERRLITYAVGCPQGTHGTSKASCPQRNICLFLDGLSFACFH